MRSTFDRIVINPPIRAGKKVIYKMFEDAFKHLIDYINIYEINVIGEYGCTFEDMTNLQSEQYLLDKIVEQFEKLSDCNIDENDTWIDACRVVLTIKKLRMQKLKEEIK